jgi:hypothetical protein
LEDQDEGILNDVLEELDRERSKRAELEARVRVVEQDLYSEKRKNANSTNTSLKDYMSLKTEAEGYLELLDALTQDRPAFSKKQKLPIHVVRLLEIIPWDPRAKPHMFGQEQVYEWQMFRSDNNWQKELRYFPTFFKTLPIVSPQPGKTVGEAPTNSSPPKQCVLTNCDISQILNIDKGYPLPQDGGDWQWIGGWRIEKTGDTDDKGWSYSNSPDITIDPSSYFSDLRMPQPGARNIIKRRRRWTRSRVMVDYPSASAMTKEYLKLVAQKASSDVSLEKLSNQLVDTKMNLTSLEAEHLSLQDEVARQLSILETDIAEKNKIIAQFQSGVEETSSSSAGSAAAAIGSESKSKELRSVVTQWVSSTVSKKQTDTTSTPVKANNISDSRTLNSSVSNNDLEDGHPTTPAQSKQLMFDSLRGKGSDLLEKIKLKGGDEIERLKHSGVTEKAASVTERLKHSGVTEKLTSVKFGWHSQVKEGFKEGSVDTSRSKEKEILGS